MNRYAGQRVLVLGLGATGLSLARYLEREGARVRVADTREAPSNALKLAKVAPGAELAFGPYTEQVFEGIDLIAISPGVPKDQPLISAAVERGVPLVGDIELFARELPLGQHVLGITGSNGKTTTTTLTGELCRACGLSTVVAGNIGTPVLDWLCDQGDVPVWPDAVVLELSSFQLETTSNLYCSAATVLNVSEDHLDRYPGMWEYAAAKARIFQHAEVKLINRDDGWVTPMAVGGPVWSFGAAAPKAGFEWGLVEDGETWLAEGGERLIKQSDLKLLGRHNALNVLAALGLARAIDLPYSELLPAAAAFRGLAHRVELVREIGGVAYIDDSKGTNVGAVVAALAGIGRPVVLIAGGDGKGQNFSPLHAAVAAHCRAVVLIGRDAPAINTALFGTGVPIEQAPSLEAAVQIAAGLARSGDAVMLSPACASFDMFRDYLHRSEVFVAAVNALAGNGVDSGGADA